MNSPRSFTLADLENLPWTTVEASGAAARGPARGTWLGVSLWTLLDAAGGVAAPPRAVAHHALVVTGRDGRAVTLSLGAIGPDAGPSAAAVIAWSRNGQPFDPARGFRLVVAGQRAGGRALRDVVSIVVK